MPAHFLGRMRPSPSPRPSRGKGASRPLSPTVQGEKQPLNRRRSLTSQTPGARARFASVLTRSVLPSTLDPLRMRLPGRPLTKTPPPAVPTPISRSARTWSTTWPCRRYTPDPSPRPGKSSCSSSTTSPAWPVPRRRQHPRAPTAPDRPAPPAQACRWPPPPSPG